MSDPATLLRRVGQVFDSASRFWLARPRWLRWVLVVAIMALLWIASSRPPGTGTASLVWGLAHNAMHPVAFGVLAAASWFACRGPGGGSSSRAATFGPIALTIAYGVLDEVHQSFVPGRMSSAADVLSDAFGAALAVWLLRLRVERRPARLVHGLVLALACIGSVVLATVGPC